jgi:hypothetical protein
LIVELFAIFIGATGILNLEFNNMESQKGQELFNLLIESQFDFIERDVIYIEEIFDVVYFKFRNLCDNNDFYTDNNRTNKVQPGWKHSVRKALGTLSFQNDKIHRFGIDGFWEFT